MNGGVPILKGVAFTFIGTFQMSEAFGKRNSFLHEERVSPMMPDRSSQHFEIKVDLPEPVTPITAMNISSLLIDGLVVSFREIRLTLVYIYGRKLKPTQIVSVVDAYRRLQNESWQQQENERWSSSWVEWIKRADLKGLVV